MYRTLNISTVAATALGLSAVIAAEGALRIRATDEGIQIRPGSRTNTSNLPKGEVLRSASAKANAAVVGLPADVLPQLEAGQVFAIEPGSRYGWFTFRSVNELAKGQAGATVRAK